MTFEIPLDNPINQQNTNIPRKQRGKTVLKIM